jgi:electron transport complex protein RnfG
MKKLESSLKNMLLVLTGVTVIAVGLLAYVNELTKEPIAAANMKALNDALKKVAPEFDNNPVTECDTIFEEKNGKQIVQYIVYPVKRGGQSVGTAVQATSLGFGGEIKVLVGFDVEGKIYDYALLAHTETPGLGSKADVWFKKGNRGEIVGRNPGEAPLTVKNDGGQIDAITASTITSRAFLNAVNAAYAAYKGNPDGFTSASQQAETDTNTSATTKVESTDSISVN